MSGRNQFSGEPSTRWLTEPGPDRTMVVLEDFSYTDPQGKVWVAPKGTRIDGATIPHALWSLVGSPYTGDYRRASIVHDAATNPGAQADRRAADRMFFHACRAGGCSVRDSILLYIGVRIGAHLPAVAAWQPAARGESAGPRVQRTPAEDRIESDFRRAAELILAAGESDDIDLLEARTDAALSRVAEIDLRGH